MTRVPASVQIGATFLRNLVRRRGLILNLVARNFRQRHGGFAMGWLWAAVHLAAVVRGTYRSCILLDQWPSSADLGLLSAVSLITFLAGVKFFQHSKRAFGDVL